MCAFIEFPGGGGGGGGWGIFANLCLGTAFQSVVNLAYSAGLDIVQTESVFAL